MASIGSALHLIIIDLLPIESPFLLQQLTIRSDSHSGGITVIMSIPALPADFIILTQILLVLQPFHFYLTARLSNQVLVYQTMYTSDIIYLRKTIVIQELVMISFSSYFLISINYFQPTIFISYTLFTNNNLISFDHSVSNFKDFTFLIIPLTNIYFSNISISFCFTFDLINSFPSFHLVRSPCLLRNFFDLS